MSENPSITSRERVFCALEHREPDRVAVDFGATDCSSVHVIAYNRLRKQLGIEPRPIRLACLTQQIAEVDPEVAGHFGADAAGLYFHPREWRMWEEGYGFPLEVPERWCPERDDDGSWVVRDAQGVVRQQQTAGGLYFDAVSFPLSDVASPDQLDDQGELFQRWDWSPVFDESVEQYAGRAESLRASGDRAVVANWNMHYLQSGQLLRGYEQFMADLLTDEPLVRRFWDKLHEVYLERAAMFFKACGASIDVVFFTDDLGSQQGAMISPDLYRKLLKPYWKELIALVKQHGKKVIMHSCGAISDFLPDLIDMGVDAVNPVQITAAGMSPERLKREFGDAIAFWGGGVSTQGMLDQATPERIRDEVRRNIEIFAPGGGFVFTQVHNIQANVPPENIIAAFEAATEYV